MDDSKQKLLEALQRMIEGKPIKVKASRKISPTSVEEEANVGKGLSYYKSYSNILALIKEEQQKQKQGSRGVLRKHTKSNELDCHYNDYIKENEILRERIVELEAKLNAAIKFNSELAFMINRDLTVE